MTKSKTHKKKGAAALVTAALIVLTLGAALVFTACPNNAGGNSGNIGGGNSGGGTPPTPPPVTKYKVELDRTIGGNVKVTPALSEDGMAAENTVLTFTAEPLQGYDLEKWELDGTAVNGTALTYTLKVTANAQVFVFFKRNGEPPPAMHTVTLTEPEHGSVDTVPVIPPGHHKVPEGTELIFRAEPDAGYAVDKWTVSSGSFLLGGTDGSTSATLKITEAVTVTVTFKQVQFKIDFGVDGGHGTLKAIVKGKEISSGEQVPLWSNVHFIAKPESGYTVDGWTKNGDSVNGTHLGYNYSATENADVRVRFKDKTYKIEFGTTGEGSGTVSATANGTSISSPYEAVKGTQIVFTVSPTYTYTVGTKAVNIKANIALNKAQVFFTKKGDGSLRAYINGSEIHSGDYVKHGKEILFIGWTDSNNAIDKWERDGSVLTEAGVEPQYRHTVTALYDKQPLNVKVYFKAFPYDQTFRAAGVEFKMSLTSSVINGTVGSNNISNNNEHKVSLSTYYIADTEVTQKLYQAVMGDNPSFYNDNPLSGDVQEKRPVESINCFECIVFKTVNGGSDTKRVIGLKGIFTVQPMQR